LRVLEQNETGLLWTPYQRIRDLEIEDILWLHRIVDKLAWKHNILPSEVEETLNGNCRIFLKEKGKVEGENL
jgi:hypothetical protein